LLAGDRDFLIKNTTARKAAWSYSSRVHISSRIPWENRHFTLFTRKESYSKMVVDGIIQVYDIF
jgi:hypothetical protein